MDAYLMRRAIRSNIGESTASHWLNVDLVREMNIAHRAVATMVINAPGDWLLKQSASITPAASVITLPSDCVLPAYVEEVTSGTEIRVRGTVRERRLGRISGTSLGVGAIEAYMQGNTLVVNADNYVTPVYVWYQKRVLDLACGTCQASTEATSVYFNLANFPSGVDDYYVGETLKVWDASTFALNFSGVITDYAGLTGVASIADAAATPAANDKYGTVSVLPEELMELIILKTTVRSLAKPSSTFEKEIFSFFRAELREAIKAAERFLATRQSGSTYTRIVEA